MATRKKATSDAKTTQAYFDEDLMGTDFVSLYDLELSKDKEDAYDVQVINISNDAEQYMLDQFHQQHVAVEGRTAMTKLVTTRIGDMGTNTVLSMAAMLENIEIIEASARLGRLGRKLQDFNNRVVDHTAKLFMETDGIGARTMQEDLRRDVYKPPPTPPRRPKKGLIPTIGKFLFGEE